jgi:hypothetical protein
LLQRRPSHLPLSLSLQRNLQHLLLLLSLWLQRNPLHLPMP